MLSKSIAGSVALNTVVSGVATAGDDGFVIDAPNATSIAIIGDTGAGTDEIIIKIDDLTQEHPTYARLLLIREIFPYPAPIV